MFLSTLQLSYSVNTIGSILTQMKDSSESMRKKLTLINEYMEDKKIGPTLQSKYLMIILGCASIATIIFDQKYSI